MFTLFMMLLSSLPTLYFTRPGFKKAVHYFFSTSDKAKLGDPSDDPVSKDYVDGEIPMLDQPVRRESDLGWRAWEPEDETWTEEDEREDGVR